MNCYFCGTSSVSREHVPPRCFFPDDVGEGLISVPSCDEHNSRKSTDDEYFRGVFLSSASVDGNPHVATQRQTHLRAMARAVKRGFERVDTREQLEEIVEVIERHGSQLTGAGEAVKELEERRLMRTGLYGLMNFDVQEAQALGADGEPVPTTSFAFDLGRLKRFLDCVARGLLFHEIGEVWTGVVRHLPHAFLDERASEQDIQDRNYLIEVLKSQDVKGVHPSIFYYSLLPGLDDEDRCYAIGFCFFESFHFTTFFGPK